MAFSIDDLKKNFPRIGKFESGEAKPTFGQMERLAEKYEVPKWVFVENELPDPHRLDSKPALKSLFREKAFCDYRARKILSRVERCRELAPELGNDSREPVPRFSPPAVEDESAAEAARALREWLVCSPTESRDFGNWRRRTEDRNIFVLICRQAFGMVESRHVFLRVCLGLQTDVAR